MKKIFCFATAAALLSGCVGGGTIEQPTPSPAGDLNVRISMVSAPLVRHIGYHDNLIAGNADKSTLRDGYLCFLNSAGIITAVYHIGASATSGLEILADDLNLPAGVTLERVPGTSVQASIVANIGTASFAPAVGDNLKEISSSVWLKAEEVTALSIVSKGTGTMTLAPDDKTKGSVDIELKTIAAYLKIKALNFAGVMGRVQGIYINRHYDLMALDQHDAHFVDSTNPADYEYGTEAFPRLGELVYYDRVGEDITTNPQKLTPVPSQGGKFWGYCLFTSDTAPQIVVRLTGVTVSGAAIDGDRFVTVGLMDKNTGVPLTRLEPGKVYTIEDDALVIKPEHLNPTPGIGKLAVQVTVKPLEWHNADPIVPDI